MEDKSTKKLDSLTNFEEKLKIRFWLKNKTKTIQGHQDALQTITALWTAIQLNNVVKIFKRNINI